METLPKNILDNEDYENCEFILLDYNSTDGLEDYVKTHLSKYISSGKLVYYKTTTPLYFHRAHSLNTVFKLSTGDILCNIDADNYTGKGFATYVNEIFNKNDAVFLTVDLEIYRSDVCGRVCSKREDFFKISGYDETMDCWGHDDDDIKSRLSFLGLKKMYIEGSHFLNAISHDFGERLANEYTMKFLKEIYLSDVTSSAPQLLMLFSNQKFEYVVGINNRALNSQNTSFQPPEYYHHFDINEMEGFSGCWIREDNSIVKLDTENGGTLELVKINDTFELRNSNLVYNFSEIKDKNMLDETILTYSYAKNRIRLRKTIENRSIAVNKGEVGKAIVYKNFNYDCPISS